MRAFGIAVCAAGGVVAVACLDAGMSPPAGRTVGAEPIKFEITPLPDETPAVAAAPAAAKVTEPPASPPPAPAPPPAPPVLAAITHAAPDGVVETCNLLAKFPFEPPDLAADPDSPRWYRKDDFDTVAALCAMDLYAEESTDAVTAVGVCPKLHWTTPALELYDLAEFTPGKSKFEKARCGRWHHRGGVPKVAKLKIPVYAKEPESALMYFHFSRLLGNAAFVYPATWRTVSRKQFLRVANDAIAYIAKLTTTATPLPGWQTLLGRHKKRVTDTVGGSLAKNPRGETSHHAFLYYPDQKRRISTPGDFRTRPFYKLVNSKRAVSDQLDFDPADPDGYRDDLQALTYAQDFTDLVILDHLFNARDRAGNISARVYHHFADGAGHLRWKKDATGVDASHAVDLERLLLKDNDDGLLWHLFGKLNLNKLVPDLRHLDSVMYLRMQWLAQLMADPTSDAAIKTYFTDAVHVQPATYDEVRERFLAMAERFRAKYDAGELMLDLDLDALIAAAPALPPDDGSKHHRRRSHH